MVDVHEIWYAAVPLLSVQDHTNFSFFVTIKLNELYILIPVLMTLTFTQNQRGTRKADTCVCNHSVLKWYEAAQTFAVADYAREMAAKKSFKNGKSGSFEHLLFLFPFIFLFCLFFVVFFVCFVFWSFSVMVLFPFFLFFSLALSSVCVCVCVCVSHVSHFLFGTFGGKLFILALC